MADVPEIDYNHTKWDFKKSKTFMAGIIPIAGIRPDLNSQLPPYMARLAPDYSIIQNAVYAAASVGCDSIWIACNEDVSPMIKNHIGQWVGDPRQLTETGWPQQPYNKSWKEVPIYYTPIENQFIGKRDSYAWSIFSAAARAYKINRRLSTLLVPEVYFVSFPYCVWSVENLREVRLSIRHPNNTIFEFDGLSVADNINMPFAFNSRVLKLACRRIKRAPLKAGYGIMARDLKFDEIFGRLVKKYGDKVPLSWYYGLEDWDSYCRFLGSEHREEMIVPPVAMFNREPDLVLKGK